ncbi:bifunctional 2-C-methyl-D-erythritol 4-phosphate cytidylyltransferase/2-C-methyl-D-erythritol 2,4-cyclodiphosphate synthase [Aliiroseovarius sp. YM-037]|uniref:bifunctional 2-C-methyl-D-erythritol 4-phosphate cytidylyltransferase/2-C-methyl-D-erythritol 2,4-cyclodiphosphate synthase n=1 Tax=Aliiroseovarius sp. YM-037 TaxID=3341728 RepID=UPI003A7FAEDF
MSIAVIIVAAGRGTRMGGGVPKQYRMLAGQSVLNRTLHKFTQVPKVSAIVVVINPEDEARFVDSVSLPVGLPIKIVHGGAVRHESVAAGLSAIPDDCDRVLIHDGARPLVSDAVIGRVIDALDVSTGAAPGLAVTDALWRADDGRVSDIASRDGLFRAQTPQGFRVASLRDAYAEYEGEAGDDVGVARAYGLDVQIVEGDEDNLKLTYAADFARAERILGADMDIRTGNGFDVHRFGDGDHVMLCGIAVPFDCGLQGHSDADVGMHAVTDAIYGALAEGDIGQHFPPSDPQWKGAESHIFLDHACTLARSRGYQITHADCTLICEVPKIGPHADAMRAEMARIMGLDVRAVSVKATTSERLGFTGRGEGIAALATITLVRT